MKNMLKNSAPGQRQKRSRGRENRWLRWAQSLAGRRLRVAANQRGLSLTFLQPAEAAPFSRDQWTQAVWTIAPRINLSIGPILRSLNLSTRDESARRRMIERKRSPLSSQFATNSGGGTIVERRGESPRMESVEHIEDLAAIQRPFVVTQQSNPWWKPLQKVFARAVFEEAGETGPVTRARHETLLVERSLQVVRRVVDERRRVEEQARRSLVAREQRSASRTPAAAQETVMQSPRGLRVGAQGPAQTAAPVIDIEQLTDRVVRNIDSRIIAHRERMGKLF
jgi:hypothetical protein